MEREGRSGGEEYAEKYAKVTAMVRAAKDDVGEEAENGGVQNGGVEGETKKNRLMDKMRGMRVSCLLGLLKQC